MQALKLEEQPSIARRRLSQHLQQNQPIPLAQIANRRRSSLFLTEKPSLDDTADYIDEDNNNNNDTNKYPDQKQIKNRKASVTGRRASGLTRYFALNLMAKDFLERPGLRPTIISAMLYLKDHNPSIDKVREVLKERLLDIPPFRSVIRLEEKKGNAIFWDPLPRCEIDLGYHVKDRDGCGTFDFDSDLQALVSDIYLTDWDISQPLWKADLIRNIKDGRSILLVSIDHTLGDGVALLQVLLSILDDPPSGVKSFQTPRRKINELKPNKIKKRWSHRVVDFVTGIGDGIQQTFAPKDDPPSSLKVPTDRLGKERTGKRFVQTRAFELKEINLIRAKLPGTTINDILMALHAVALRRYFEATDDTILKWCSEGGVIHADFIVNMRQPSSKIKGDGKNEYLGNKVTIATFPFPMDCKDTIDALWRCKAQIDKMKLSPIFYVRYLITKIMLNIASANLLAKVTDEEGVKSTFTISNVMGPQEESSIGGYVLDDLNFTASSQNGMNCGVISYNGKLRITVMMDKLVDGDPHKLKDCLEHAYDDLKTDVLVDGSGRCLLEPLVKTPMSAKVLEFLCYAMIVSIPVFVFLWGMN